MIVMPAMPEEQTASWHALLELYDVLAQGWTLIGGQLVRLHCAERGQSPSVPPTMPTPWSTSAQTQPSCIPSPRR